MQVQNVAAAALVKLATMVAVRVVLAQDEFLDNEGGALSDQHKMLSAHLEANPITDPVAWLGGLFRHESVELRKVALRVCEVRKVYLCGEDGEDSQFAWAKMKASAEDILGQQNSDLMRDFLMASMAKGDAERGGAGEGRPAGRGEGGAPSPSPPPEWAP